MAAPRLHGDGSSLRAEPGFPGAGRESLAARDPGVEWGHRDLYFGGLHLVATPDVAVGDPRRGGAIRVTRPE